MLSDLLGITIHYLIIGLIMEVLLLNQTFVLNRLGTALSRKIKTFLHLVIFNWVLPSLDSSFHIMAILEIVAKLVVVSFLVNRIGLVRKHVWLLRLEKVIITVLCPMVVNDLCGALFTSKPEAKGLNPVRVAGIGSSAFRTIFRGD